MQLDFEVRALRMHLPAGGFCDRSMIDLSSLGKMQVADPRERKSWLLEPPIPFSSIK